MIMMRREIRELGLGFCEGELNFFVFFSNEMMSIFVSNSKSINVKN